MSRLAASREGRRERVVDDEVIVVGVARIVYQIFDLT
jgi:hypothetical protein